MLWGHISLHCFLATGINNTSCVKFDINIHFHTVSDWQVTLIRRKSYFHANNFSSLSVQVQLMTEKMLKDAQLQNGGLMDFNRLRVFCFVTTHHGTEQNIFAYLTINVRWHSKNLSSFCCGIDPNHVQTGHHFTNNWKNYLVIPLPLG